MAAIIKNLTPPQVAVADYEIAQSPVLGGELEVWLTAARTLLLGIAQITDDAGTVAYEYINRPKNLSSATPGPILAFVLNECQSDAAPVITLGDLTATMIPAEWAGNQSFNFGATRGVELIGPNSLYISHLTKPTITGAKRGSRFAFVQFPRFDQFVHCGATTAADIELPTPTGKVVGDGLQRNRWMKIGNTTEGKLKITTKSLGADDGLNRFRGQRCCAMLVTRNEGKIVTVQQYATNFVPGAKITNPEAEADSSLDGEGMFQFLATLLAPGDNTQS